MVTLSPFRCTAWVIGCVLLNTASAQEAPAAPTEQAWLEKSRSATYTGAKAIARTVDGWFGNAPFEASGGDVSGYLRIGSLWKQNDGTDNHLRFRLNAKLPNLQNKAYIFIGRDNERDELKDQPTTFSQEELLKRESRKDDRSFFAGMGYSLRDNIDFRLGVHGGWKLYAQARYRHIWQITARDTVYFRESLFWSIHEHLGSTTVLDYEHQLSPSLLLRWGNVGTITQRNNYFSWHSSLGLHKSLPRARLVSLELLTEGDSRRSEITEYGVRASWQQPLYKDWLIGKTSLGHFWPKDKLQPRDTAWAVGFSVEMHY